MKGNHMYTAVLMLSVLSLCIVLSGCQRTGQQEPALQPMQGSPEAGNGVIVSCNGDDMEVTVPDTIAKVSSDTFMGIQSPEKVTRIKLNETVDEISPTAFDSFPSLREVTVPKDNKFFRSATDESWGNTYLCGIDTPIVFCFPGDGSSINLSGGTDTPYFYGLDVSVSFVCNGAVFTLQAKQDSDDVMRWYCSSMRHGEDTLVFIADEDFQGGNYRVNILRTNSDDIVFQRKSGCSADAYILTSSGDHANSYSWGVNDGALSFYLGERGELRYEKVGYDYCDFEQYAVCPAGIDGNALYSEGGTASLVEGQLVLVPDKQCTVSDYWRARGK